jgi:hypothetical protein
MLDDVGRLTGVVEKLEDLFGDGHGKGGVKMENGRWEGDVRGRRW